MAGKEIYEHANNEDLQLAQNTLKDHFIVGLTNRMEESIKRFNVVTGIDEESEKTVECMDKFFGEEAKRKRRLYEKKNSNVHPKVRVINCDGGEYMNVNHERMVMCICCLQFTDKHMPSFVIHPHFPARGR